MEVVEAVVHILKKSEVENKLDLRVTYTHSGVKVSISYYTSSESQKKPFPTLKEALLNALDSFCRNAYRGTLLENYCYTYQDSSKNERVEDLSPERRANAEEHMEIAEKMLKYAKEAFEFVDQHFSPISI